MSSDSPSIGNPALTRALCVVIVVLMIAAVLYTLWIGISNFSRIGV
jgi:flagellar basal body-associated protein FliL